MHAPGHVLDRGDVQTGRDESSVPAVDVVGDDVATGVIRCRIEVWPEIKVEHALIVEVHERKPVVVPLNVETCGLTETNRLGHVDDGQRGRHVDRADTRAQPADTDAADLDLVMTEQRRHHRLVTILTAARTQHTASVRRRATLLSSRGRGLGTRVAGHERAVPREDETWPNSATRQFSSPRIAEYSCQCHSTLTRHGDTKTSITCAERSTGWTSVESSKLSTTAEDWYSAPRWRRDRHLESGAAVEVMLEPEGPQRDDLADDLAVAFLAHPAAAAFFDSIAQFYRRAYLRYIDATKRRLAERVRDDHGHIDVLVNDIWGGEVLKGGPATWNTPIWNHDLDDGLRILRLAIDTHLITSHHLLPLMINEPGGLLVEVTDGTADYNASSYRISVFYDLAKVDVNRLGFSQGHELQPHDATAVAITPGWLRSEMMLDNFGVTEHNWREALNPDRAGGHPNAPQGFAASESPRYVGCAVAAMASDPDRARWNQHSVSSAQLAREYGFTDIDGSQPDAWAEH